MKKLMTFEGRPKIYKLIWDGVEGDLDASLLCQFLEVTVSFKKHWFSLVFQKNLENRAVVAIYLRNPDLQAVFAAAVVEKINSWPEERKPTTFPHRFPLMENQILL